MITLLLTLHEDNVAFQTWTNSKVIIWEKCERPDLK